MQFYLRQVSNVIRAKMCGKVISPNLFSLTGIYIYLTETKNWCFLNNYFSTHSPPHTLLPAIRQFHEFVKTELWVPLMERRQRRRNFTGQEVTVVSDVERNGSHMEPSLVCV